MPTHNVSEDTTQELLFVLDQAKNNILAWKAHLLRSVNQDKARLDVLDTLNECSMLLVQDWAMKFLPREYRESQSDWFSKRGLSWHITVATRRQSPNQGFEMMTFAHVFAILQPRQPHSASHCVRCSWEAEGGDTHALFCVLQTG